MNHWLKTNVDCEDSNTTKTTNGWRGKKRDLWTDDDVQKFYTNADIPDEAFEGM